MNVQAARRATARDQRALNVALVFMPFAIAERPSIQLGLLAEIARRDGHRVDCHHLNLELAAQLPEVYGGLCTFRGHMTGEWLFSVAAFGPDAHQDDAAYLEAFPSEVAQAARGNLTPDRLIALRRERLPAFIDGCVEDVEWDRYDVVGFSSTFQQNTASLALARRLKARWPALRVVFGGANMEGGMGLETARAFPFIDHVATGEGDAAFPALLGAIARGEDGSGIPGVVGNGGSSPVPARLFHDLDGLPIPDYEEYFARYQRLDLARQQRYFPALPLETARGCWWGEKHHCTFCGLNGDGMGFRRKSPDRMLEEIGTLSRRYGVTMFQSTDNIMDMSYLKTVFPEIERSRQDYTFFYEVKSNITKAQLQQMRRGGVMWIQPGIESLSTRILRLMDKGCTLLQNVRLLKWALYYKVRVGWNLLWGFPGETAEDYRAELAVLRSIVHLEPPNACGRIWLERFSPLYFDRDRFPAAHVEPERSYSYVYPRHVDLDRLAYFFDYDLLDTTRAEAHRATESLVTEWDRRWHSDLRPTLSFRSAGDTLWIHDSRWPESTGTHRFSGPLAEAYLWCSETMRSAEQVCRHVNDTCGAGALTAQDAEEVLQHFCAQDLMVGEDGSYLSLALPSNPNW